MGHFIGQSGDCQATAMTRHEMPTVIHIFMFGNCMGLQVWELDRFESSTNKDIRERGRLDYRMMMVESRCSIGINNIPSPSSNVVT
jgi:hypothetical protein